MTKNPSPQGLIATRAKAQVIQTTYAALKRRSSTVAQAFTAANKAFTPANKTFTPILSNHEVAQAFTIFFRSL
jgi:hypothetical protein